MDEPRRIGPYDIIECIALGGMGTVYKARHIELDRIVALKVLRREVAGRPNDRVRFQREGRVLARLTHPNIAQVYDADADVDSGQYYLAMEYFANGTLQAQLAVQGALPVQQALHIARQIATALTHAHAQGVIHRDIKPSNILRAGDGRYVLTDFGIAQSSNMTGGTPTMAMVGTPAYMSPEQIRGKPEPRSDIYSLGIVLYEMLTGKPPFEADSPVTLIYQQISEAPTPIHRLRSDVPTEVRTLVHRAITKKPQDRYESAEAFSAAIAAQLAASPSVAPASSPSRKRLWPLMAGAVVLLGIAVGVAVQSVNPVSLPVLGLVGPTAITPTTTAAPPTVIAIVKATSTAVPDAPTVSPTHTSTPVPTPTSTPTLASTASATATSTPLPTTTTTTTATATATSKPRATASATRRPTRVATAQATTTLAPTAVASATPTPQPTNQPQPSQPQPNNQPNPAPTQPRPEPTSPPVVIEPTSPP